MPPEEDYVKLLRLSLQLVKELKEEKREEEEKVLTEDELFLKACGISND